MSQLTACHARTQPRGAGQPQEQHSGDQTSGLTPTRTDVPADNVSIPGDAARHAITLATSTDTATESVKVLPIRGEPGDIGGPGDPFREYQSGRWKCD